MSTPARKSELIIRLSGGRTLRYVLRPRRALSRLLAMLLVTAGAMPAYALDPNALPSGAQLSAGAATVSQSGNRLNVNQASDRAILNWSSFNIGSNSAVNFAQPNASSVALNRVLSSGGATEIQGRLSANGQVFLINPSGVLFGKHAQVDVGGLVASTLSITDANFLAGRHVFANGGAAGSVINQGALSAAQGGYIALLAPEVRNEGVIAARLGTAALAAGDQVTLDFSGDRLISLAVNQSAMNALVENKHLIAADGGTVILAARSAGDLAATVVSSEGLIRAASVSEVNGVIRLEGGERGIVAVSGTLDASGRNAGETGGTVKVLGDKVGLFAGTKIDASGDAAGGTVLIGGNYQGKGAEQNARFAFVDQAAQVHADALTSGNGGKVVVWSDDATRYYGSISARGGPAAGDGGSVEVSGKRNLDFTGRIDVAAPNGTGGRVLLDPQDIVLNTTAQPSPPNNANSTADVAFADAPAAGTYTIQVADVTGYSELFLQATRDITVSSALAMGAGNSLRFEANNNININGALTVSGAGSINLKADADSSGTGTVALGAAVTSQAGGISLSGAGITSTAAGTVSATGAANANAGNVTINATGNASLAGSVSAGGGAASAGNPGRSGGTIAITAAGVALGSAVLTAIGSAGSGASQTGGAGGTINITSTNGISGTGAMTASGAAGGTGIAIGGAAGSVTLSNSGAGNISVGALTARTGNAVTTGAGGAAGSVSVSNTAAAGSLATGAIITTGGSNGNGGAVSLTTTGTLSAGAITTSGGAANAGTSGRNAGDVTLNAGGAITALGIVTASGSAGVLTGDRAGGNGGAVSITGVGGIAAAAMTASGGTAAGTNAAGGSAGSITVANSGSGNVTTGALAAQTGNALGTGAGGAAGFITVSNTAAAGNLTTGTVTTTGGTKGHGGNVSLSALGALSTGAAGAISTAGGTNISGNAGRNAGSVTLSGAGVSTGTGAITASGTAGVGANQAGGNGAAVQITSTGAITTGAISSAGGAGITPLANGGNAGSITVTNNSATVGAIALGALTTTAGNAFGTGTGGTTGAVLVTNNAAGLGLTTGAITAGGATNANGGAVTLSSQGAVSVSGLINTSAVARGAGVTGSGMNAGNITLTGTNRSVSGAITASGGAGLGTNQAGGAAGVVSITGAGTLSTGAITASAGAATGTGAGGSAGSITASGSNAVLGALSTAGPAASNAHGGAVSLTTTGTLSAGAITTSGGAAIAGNAGRNAGDVTLNAGGAITALGIVTASGSAGVLTGDRAGGNGGAVSITGVGGIAAAAMTASGGTAAGTNAAGGSAGSITVANSGSGNVTTGALAAQTGNALGTGAGGAAGFITVSNTAAAGNLTTGTVTTTGGTKGHGGNVSLSALGALSTGAAGAISTAGGTNISGNAGRNAGSVTLSGAGVSTGTGAITASGTAGVGANQAGGNGAAVQITSTGAITTGAISSAGGAGITPLANGGNAGSITVTNNSATVGAIALGALTTTAGNAFGTGTGGTTGAVLVTNNAAGLGLTTGAITAGGATNANGGAVTLSSQGAVSVSGLINTSAVARGAGVTGSGMNAGNITLTGTNRSVSGAITASGGAGLGTNQAGGAAGVVSITGAGTLSTGAITASAGAATGTGAGGSAGSITASGSNAVLGALTTTGGSNGNGGAVSLTSTGTLSAGAITTSGGAAIAGNAGRNAGNVTVNAGGAITALGAITASGSAGNGASMAGGNGGAVSLADTGDNVTAGTISTTGGNAGATGNANGGSAGAITVDAGGAVPTVTLTGNLTATGGARVGSGTAGAGAQVWVKDATTLSTSVTINTTGGTVGGAGGSIRLDGALNEDATARTLALTAGSGAVTLAGGAATNAVTTLSATGGSVALGSVRTKGAQSYTGATSLAGDLATLGTAGADTVTFNSAVTLTGNSSVTTAGGAGDNLTIAQTINGGFDLALNSGALGTIATSAVIGGGTQLNAFSASGAGLTLGASITANSILGTTPGVVTLNNGGTVLRATGTGDALVLAATGAGGVFTNNVGAGALNASNPAGRFLVWSRNPASDTRGALAYDFKQYGATYGSTAVADGNSNNNGFLYAIAPVLSATLVGPVAKTYDGGTSASLAAANYTAIAGAIDGDVAAGAGMPASGTYDNRNAGSGKTITVAGAATATNGSATVYGYQLTASNAVGTINQRALTVTAQTDTKTYDGTTGSAVAPVISAGALQSGDSTTSFAQTYDNRNAGSGKTLSAAGAVNDGNGGNNYSYSFVTDATGVINQRALTVTAQTDTKTYDGTTGSAVAPVISAGALQSGDSTTSFAQTYDNRNAGSGKTLSAAGAVSDGNGGNNYSYTFVSDATGVISPRAITGDITAASKTYDATRAATITGRSLVGVLGADAVSYSGGTATFDTKNVAAGKTVTGAGLALTGADAGNYTVNATAVTTADITARALTLTAAAQNKTYDGNTTAVVSLSDNRVAGDLLILSVGAADFNSKNAGIAKAVNVSGIGLSGADAGNYTFNNAAATAADISARALTVTAAAQSKVYDGNTAATVTLNDNRISGDALALSNAAATFDSKNVGTAKPVNVSGIGVSGADAGNYTFNATASISADITARPLTVIATAQNKVYDGSSTATVALSDNGVAGDLLTLAVGAADFNDKNAGIAKPVSVRGIAVAGADARNYTLNTGAIAGADITPANLDARIVGNPTKTYDGSTAATLAAGNYSLAGLVGAESLIVTQTAGSYDGKDAGTRVVTATLAGGDFSATAGTLIANYRLPAAASGAGTISPAALSVTADDKSRPAGTANPPFSASYGGFKASDGPGSLSGSLVLVTPATIASQTGSYRITPSGQTAANYTINFVDGVLTVSAPASTTSGAALSTIASVTAPPALPPAFSPAAVAPAGVDAINTLPATAAGSGPGSGSGTGADVPGGESAGSAVDGFQQGDSGLVLERISSTVSVGGCGVNSPEGRCRSR